MSAKIYVEAPDVWEHFKTHIGEARSGLICLAENEEYGITIYMTESGGFPLITVDADGDEILEEEIESNLECDSVVAEIYDNYLTSNVIDILIGVEEEENEYTIAEELDEIEERELELDDAVYGLLSTLVPNLHDISDDPDEVYEDVKDHICEYLYQKHGISIYRPMILEDEDGSDYFTDFPYPEMELDED